MLFRSFGSLDSPLFTNLNKSSVTLPQVGFNRFPDKNRENHRKNRTAALKNKHRGPETSALEDTDSVHYRYIQPEFQRAETGADVLRDADDRRGQAAADLTGLGQILAVGQADDRTGKEGVACAGGVDDVHLLGGYDAALAGVLGVHGTLTFPSLIHGNSIGENTP